MEKISLICSNCSKHFLRPSWQYNGQISSGRKLFFCNRTCYKIYAKYHPLGQPFQKLYDSRVIAKIKDLKKTGKTHQEIADKLNIPIGSVGRLLHS